MGFEKERGKWEKSKVVNKVLGFNWEWNEDDIDKIRGKVKAAILGEKNLSGLQILDGKRVKEGF